MGLEPSKELEDWVEEGCLVRTLHWVEEGERDSNCQGEEEDSFRRLSCHHSSSLAPPLWALLVSLQMEVCSEVLIHSCICMYSVPIIVYLYEV